MMKANRITLDKVKYPCSCVFETLISGDKLKVSDKGCPIHNPFYRNVGTYKDLLNQKLNKNE